MSRVVLVTGGGRGIGRATGRAFARAGARVWLGDRDEPAATAAAAELGHGARGWRVDASRNGHAPRSQSYHHSSRLMP